MKNNLILFLVFLFVSMIFLGLDYAQSPFEAKIYVPDENITYEVVIQYGNNEVTRKRVNPSVFGQYNYISVPLLENKVIIVTLTSSNIFHSKGEYSNVNMGTKTIYLHTYKLNSNYQLYPCLNCEEITHFYLE